MNLYASITATYPEDTKEYKVAQKILRYNLQLQGMKVSLDKEFKEESIPWKTLKVTFPKKKFNPLALLREILP